MPLRIRRGTDAERLTITPLEGELIYTTDTKLVYVGDGTTVGGLDISVTGGLFGGLLGQNIDLNGFDITGLGDINTIGNQSLSGNLAVGGSITAQGNIIANGNITLGNGGGDVIVIAGEIDSNLLPGSNQYSLGSADRPWGTLYVNGVEAGGLIQGEFEGNIRAADSSIAFNASTSTFSGTLLGNVFGNIEGNLVGSLFADDSSIRVSGIDNFISNGTIALSDDVISSISNGVKFGDINDVFSLVVELNMPNGTGMQVNGITDNTLFTNPTAPALRVNTFKGTPGSPTALTSENVLFAMNFQGYDSLGNFVSTNSIISIVDNNLATGPNAVPGKLVFASYPTDSTFKLMTFDSSGRLAVGKYDATQALDVEGSGTFSGSVTASTFIQFPVYSNPTTRNTAIPSPAAGMVVFVTDSTGAGGPPKLQANTDGTVGGWVDL